MSYLDFYINKVCHLSSLDERGQVIGNNAAKALHAASQTKPCCCFCISEQRQRLLRVALGESPVLALKDGLA